MDLIYSETTVKHLPGQHDQKAHGRRGGAGDRALSPVRETGGLDYGVSAVGMVDKWRRSGRTVTHGREEFIRDYSDWVNRGKVGKPPRAEDYGDDVPRAANHIRRMIEGSKKSVPGSEEKHDYHEFSVEHASDSHESFHNDPGWKAWIEGLTPREKDALEEYIGKPGEGLVAKTEEMNKKLRSGLFDAAAHPHSETTKLVRNIDSALNKGSLHRDMILYRGLSHDRLYRGGSEGMFKVGGTFTDNGFMSTAPKRNTATSWRFLRGESPVLFRIKAPKGTKGGYLSWDELNNPYMHETEFLFPRGSNFRIDDIHFENIGSKRVQVFELTHIGE